MVTRLILSTALCGILLGGVAWAESEGARVKEGSKEVYETKEDGTQVESTSKNKTADDGPGAASSTETRTESTVFCPDGEEFNKETGKCE